MVKLTMFCNGLLFIIKCIVNYVPTYVFVICITKSSSYMRL